MKKCPYCAEEVQDLAVKCKHCGSWLDGRDTEQSHAPASVKTPSFAFSGLLGAFIAVGGLLLGLGGALAGNAFLGIVGIVLLVVGAGLGAKNK